MDIREVSATTVAVGYRGMAVSEAARAMREQHVGCLVVVEERAPGKVPIGMLTDRDIAVSVVAKDLDARNVPVGEVMSTDVVAVRDDDSVKDALRLLRRRGIRRAPVIARDGTLAGIVTVDDLLRTMVEQLDDLVGAISTELALEVQTRA